MLCTTFFFFGPYSKLNEYDLVIFLTVVVNIQATHPPYRVNRMCCLNLMGCHLAVPPRDYDFKLKQSQAVQHDIFAEENVTVGQLFVSLCMLTEMPSNFSI